MLLRLLLMLTAIFALEAPVAAEGEAGRYRLTGVQDAASGLELTADGKFRYYLIYGALDEMAEGVWRRHGERLFLTTRPAPVPPRFVLKEATLSKDVKQLSVEVTNADGQGIAGVDVQVRFSDEGVAEGYTQQDGWHLDIPAGRVPSAVALSILMYGLQSPEFPVDMRRANRLRFLLEANDLGIADFRDLPLEVGEGYVEMLRNGARFRYVRED